jgi:hypothetical protein
MSILKKITLFARRGTCLLLMGLMPMAQAQFASSANAELNAKAAGGYSVSGRNAIAWQDSSMGPGGSSGPTPVPAGCPAIARWGMQYGASIVACLFPDQRCDGDEAPASVSWRQYSTRTQYEPEGCCVREPRSYTYDCNCKTTVDANGNATTTCQQCTGTYYVAKLQGCNITKQFFSDCTGTANRKWSKVIYNSRFSHTPTTCVGRDAAGRPTAYQGTVCYDEVARDQIQAPPTFQSTSNSTGGGVGMAKFSCVGNNQWTEYPGAYNNICPLGSYNWNDGKFVGRDGPWDC